MNAAIIDTNILIDHLKGKVEARDCLTRLVEEDTRTFCSVITKIELLSGMLPGEKKQLEIFLSFFDKLEVSDEIADIAGEYMNRFRKSHGINMADAIIAATARYADMTLYTLNKKHYPMEDINAVKPY